MREVGLSKGPKRARQVSRKVGESVTDGAFDGDQDAYRSRAGRC